MAGEFDQAKVEMLIDLNMREAKEKVDSLSSQIRGIQTELRKEYSASIGNAVKKIDTEIKKHEETIKRLKTEAAKTSHQIEIDRLKSERAKIIAENKQALRDELTTLKESETAWSAILEKAQKMDSFLDKNTKKFKEENDNYAAISRNLDIVNNYLQAAKTLTADWDALLNKATISAQNLRENFTGTGLDYQRLQQQIAKEKRKFALNYYNNGSGWDVFNYQNYIKTAQGNQIKDNMQAYKSYADYTMNNQLYKIQQTVQYASILGQASKINFDQSVKKAQEIVDREKIKTTSGLSEEAMKAAEAFSKLSSRLGVAQLMLRANYAAQNLVIGGFRSILNYTVQYDAELHQLQSIAAVSDTTMQKLKESISAVATSTKFTSLEVAKAGTVLAQAGLSAKQIETTLPAIAKLATATGTDLATSTDVVTSTLNIYSLQASEAEQVTNALTTAMNESKADIAGFQTAIQYAGNFAAQLGMTYEETAAAIAAATQAGIRSKSMLGTGLRAVLTEFLKPTKNLQKQLEAVGLSISDIDVRTKGFNNVLKTLKEAGFGAVEAFRGMERRGAAFLVSIINQTDFIDDLRNKMASSTAAALANETQMKSLLNQWKNFVSVSGEAAEKGLAPITKGLSNILALINKLGTGGTGLIYSAFFGIAAPTTVLLTLASLGLSIGKIGKAVMDLVKAIRAFESVKQAAGTFEWIKNLLSMGAWGKVTIIIAGLAALGTAIYYVASKLGFLTSEWDKWQGAVEEAKGKTEEVKESLSGLNSMMDRLVTQRERFQQQGERDLFVQELLKRYPEASKVIDKVTMSYQELYEVMLKLQSLKKEEIADALAVEVGEKQKGLPLIGRELGRGLMSGTNIGKPYTTNLGWTYQRESTAYNKILEALSNSEYFKDINKGDLNRYSNRVDYYKKQGGVRIDEQAGELLINEIASVIRGTKGTANKLNALNEVKTMALDLGIPEVKTAITRLSDILESEIELERKQEQAYTASTERSYIEDINKAREGTTGIIDGINTTIDSIKNFIDIGSEEAKQRVENALKQYDLLNQELERMQQPVTYENGERKALRDYTQQEAANYLGIDEDAFSKMLAHQVELQTGLNITDFKNLSDEEQAAVKKATESLLTDNNIRDQYLTLILGAINSLEGVIGQSDFGKEEISKRKPESFVDQYKTAKEKQATVTNLKGLEKATSAREFANKNILLSSLRRKGVDVSTIDFDKYAESREAILANNQSVKGLFESYESNVAANEVSRALNEERIKKVSGKGSGGGRGNGGYKFDPEAARFRKFYSDINVATKNAATEYQNAESPLDLELARLKGNVSAAERMYGASSGVAEAESIRMRNAEKTQLPQRQENLVVYQAKIQKQLDDLIKSNDYTKYTEYEKLERQRDEALASGNDKLATTLDRQMRSLEKTYQKVASTTESLTKKNEELKEKIDENNRILEKENAERSIFGELSGGFGDAATKYVDANQRQGLDTLRGSMEFLSTNAIDAFDNSMTTMFQNIADGSMKAGEAFKEFGRSVIKTIRDVAIQMAVKQGISALFSYFGAGSSGVTETGGVNSTITYTNRAQGGIVVGPVKNRDSVDMKLTPGEYVLKKSAVDTIGKDYLDSLNYNAAATLSNSAEAINSSRDNSTNKDSTGVGGVVNVYVVGQDQQQQMTPNDVVVTITQDMLTGGQTKRLVKQIAMGSL